MALLALGVNHKTAPLEVRERLAFAPEQIPEAINQACTTAHLREAAILSTCNRTELYCSTELVGTRALLEWFGDYHGLDPAQLEKCTYVYWDEEAVRHIMRVASGLDSLVLGEPQILGQLKKAYTIAQQSGMSGAELGHLFRHTFNVAKQVRTETGIGHNPVSVAYAAVQLAEHIFADLHSSRALLIGAGETIELVARHLKRAGINSITLANRTLTNAQVLAREVDAKAIELQDLPDVLPNADIIISSTGSQLPILGKGAVEAALRQRKHKPMFMVDIAVPRDIEAQVGDLDDVYLYTVDDLTEVIEENQRGRQVAAQQAEEIIDAGTHLFLRHMRELEAVDTLTALRQQAHSISDQELEKALKRLHNGHPAEEVLQWLAHSITNKLLHQPTVQLRQAAAAGRHDFLTLTQELYQLPTHNDDTEDA